MYRKCDPQARCRGTLGLMALGLALNLGLLGLYYSPQAKTLLGDEGYYFNLATASAAGQPAVHHPFWPPLYAEAMGWLFAAFGPHRLSIQLVQIVLWFVSGLLYACIGATLFQSGIVGTTTLALYLLCPELMAFSHFLWPEIAHVFFFAMALWLLIRWPGHWASCALAGVCLGLALLTKLLLLAFMPLLAGWLVWQMTGTWQTRIGRLLFVVMPVLITIFPTLHHNAELHGRWMVADSSAFNIWVGVNDDGRADYVKDIAGREFQQFETSGASFAERDQLYRNKVRNFIQHKGFLQTVWDQTTKQYFRLFHAETFFTSQLPGGPRQAYQFPESALTSVLRSWAYLMHAVVLGAGIFGLCLLRLRPLGWPHFLLVFVVYNLGLFLLVHVKTRYVIQFLPVLMIFAGVTVQELVRMWLGGEEGAVVYVAWSRTRLVVGGLCVMLVEYLAFGP